MLAEHRVRYAIVGGVGARLQGTPYVTGDLDIVPDPEPENLARLAAALSGTATLKKAANSTEYLPHPEVQPAEFYAEYFAMYRTRYGAIDVLIELPGVGPFDAIMRNARRYDITGFGLSIYVASLEDIIRSKETAGRSKDLAALPALYEAANHLARHPDDYALSADALDVHTPPHGSDEQ
ncbi:hypothetical protein I6A84_03945 [Frankia sp. CNm7]|uniref:Nucleotidyltransferase n=2 Tax=Frankia nepalensis TaxID=1836974 RepID=A0A937UML8_9ACTN|nr:hypothetical protein [Frankia nepalensis]MBL7509249.1 hypothetical protein [Frankia nepalensis]MBL7517292.1 hypothetical protein [Frankia nepalensis]MBL7626987.1 hypothetical protein [Frankia nepalensis]